MIVLSMRETNKRIKKEGSISHRPTPWSRTQTPWLVRLPVTWRTLPNLDENKLADNPELIQQFMWEIYGLLVKQWPQQLKLGRKNTNLLRVTLIRHQFKLVGCTAYSVRPLRLKLQKTSRKQKAADRVSVLCRLVFKKKMGKTGPSMIILHQFTDITLSDEVKLDIAWAELELANARGGTNYQACEQICPNLMCTMASTAGFPDWRENGGWGNRQSASK